MRKQLIWIALLFTLTANSQKIQGFGGGAIYRHTSFKNSGFTNLDVGVAYKINQILRPEIEASIFWGSLQERTKITDEGHITSILDRSFVATNLTFCPKICLGDKNNETGTVFFQILPTYSITKVMAKGSLLTVNPNDASKFTTEVDRYSEIRHSLGIGIGIYTNGSKKYNNSLALNLYYNGIDFGNSFSNLKFSNEAKYKTDAIGLGLKFYFSFTKSKEKQ